MNYNQMTDSQLAGIMVNYIGRTNNLLGIIGRYLEGNDNISPMHIKIEYAQLKEEIREDARLVGLKKNYHGSNLYRGAFVPSITEAAAFGFTVSVNSQVNYKMYNAVEEAHYKLTKYCSFEEWGTLM